MPKPSLKNPFARRRSSGNVLDVENSANTSGDVPAQSSFRVIERPEKNTIVFDGSKRASQQVSRPFSSPLQQLRGKSVDDLTYHANGSVDTAASRKAASALKPARGSGGTTGSGASEFYQSSAASARCSSSSSTLPSSVDPENEDDELFAQKRIPHAQNSTIQPTSQLIPSRLDEPLPLPPKFTSRATRSWSFGLRSKRSEDHLAPTTSETTTTTTLPALPLNPPATSHSPTRERSLTTSSYASTAVPTKLDLRTDLGTSDFGGDFGKMFENDSLSKSPVQHRTDSEPLFPARTYKRQDSTPSPSAFRLSRANTESPWERRDSKDGLLASATTSPNLTTGNSFFKVPVPSNGYSRVAKSPSTIERASEDSQGSEQSSGRTYQLEDTQDTRMLPVSKSVTTSSLDVPSVSLSPLAGRNNPWNQDSRDVTPKAQKRVSDIVEDEPLFDASPNGPASRAKRPGLLQANTESSAPRRLTKAQFEILQKHTDPADEDSGNEDDDDDELERTKQLTTQRRKQEANMAVYRQQMKKVTGGGPSDLPNRPGLEARISSAPSLYLGGVPGTPPVDNYQTKQSDDDDEDVPLGILQAHGFPSSTRPPTRPGEYRAPSVAGQRTSQMPPFARRLPEDPYFGAGLVNPASREAFAFNNGSGSVYGGNNSQPPTPGGLVGIIATEEQQRQARRGSPNPVFGTYNTMPLPANMPAMNRASSMASIQNPAFHPPGMPMMPQMPMTNDPQLQEFMAMQMQFMQNMQAMMMQTQMQQQGAPPAAMPRAASTSPNLLGVPGMEQGRTTSMMGPPAGWPAASRPVSTFDPRISSYAPSIGGPGPGYTPSIAPSERSTIGQPSRYRPVTANENDGRTNSFTSSLTLNALSGQQERPVTEQRKSTIRIIDKPKGTPKLVSRQAETDEEEEGSWSDMMKKKLRTKRADRMSRNGGDRVALSELYPNVE